MAQQELPPRVADREDEVRGRLRAAPGVVLGLDFDGTLAPIVDDPDAAAIDSACREAVAALADRSDVGVALVSGRALADLRDRVGIEGVDYAGNHGLEYDRGTGREVHPDAAGAREAIAAVCDGVRDRVGDVPGVVVEDKAVTATVHYRRVSDDDVEQVREAVDAAVDDVDADLEVGDGKAIREVRPRIDWDKGRVVAFLAEGYPDDWLPVYVGDDVTDEDAFAVVEPDGIGIHVGRDPDTAASFRVPEQTDVIDFLELVADARDVSR